MRLIDLPITLRERAVKRQIEQGNERDVYLNVLTCKEYGGFDFDKTKEAEQGLFWAEVYLGNLSHTLRKQYRNIE